MACRPVAVCSALALVASGHGASLGPQAEAGVQTFSSAIQQMLNSTQMQNLLESAVDNNRAFGEHPAKKAAIASFVQTGAEAVKGRKEKLSQGWAAFAEKVKDGSLQKPDELLGAAKAILLQTGTLEEMQSVASATRDAARRLGGQVPLDSMIVGFSTAIAPWNKLLKDFGLPLIKADFQLFTNFFGPEGNAARLCVGSSTQVDSTYGSFLNHEVGGVNMFVGPAKWDNVPGWSFGAQGGIDDVRYFDAADFGWKWTLAREPETLGFFYEMCLVDGDAMQGSSALQTKAEAGVAEMQLPVHGSSFFGHIWCSPDWKNTPLVIEQPAAGVEPSAAHTDSNNFKAEEWDPEAEAV